MREDRKESRENREDGEDGGHKSRVFREFKEIREFREALSTFIRKAQLLILSLNSLFSLSSLFSLCPCPPQSAHLFLARRVADATLGKNPDDGLYFGVLLIVGTFFASGSRCALIAGNKFLVRRGQIWLIAKVSTRG